MSRPRIAAAFDLAGFVTATGAARRETPSAAKRFDSFTRHLGIRTSRRDVLGAILGALLAALGLGETKAACQPGEPCDCRRLGKSCTANSQCCSKLCDRGSHTCVCRGTGKSCAVNANCCSKLCSRRTGTCVCKGLRATCSADAGCCSGTCRTTSLTKPDCLSGERCCSRLGRGCTGDCDCCGITHCRDIPENGGPTCCIPPGVTSSCGPDKPCCPPATCVDWFGDTSCCIPAGQPCGSGGGCCGVPCTDGVCCRPAGGPCTELDPELCCSGACQGNRCT